LVNLYRFIAGLPAVTTDPTRNAGTQQCALMMDAQNQLSHSPPTSWACYTSAGAMAAGSSNIASTPGVRAVDLYMVDPGAGNSTSIGHRRWILSNSLGPIGIGSTPGGSCMWTLGGSGSAGKAWTAWPPGGQVPFAAFGTTQSNIDQTGWTIQSDTINLAQAQVSVTDGGVDRPVTVFQLDANYGSRYAIRFVPQGWARLAGHTYSVTVSGVTPAISYQVQVLGC
jgi:hypothetical protein